MKVKRVDWYEGSGYQLLSGFRIYKMKTGFGFDAFCKRVDLLIKPWGTWRKPRIVRFGPPFHSVWVFFGPLWLTVCRAYGGYLLSEDRPEQWPRLTEHRRL